MEIQEKRTSNNIIMILIPQGNSFVTGINITRLPIRVRSSFLEFALQIERQTRLFHLKGHNRMPVHVNSNFSFVANFPKKLMIIRSRKREREREREREYKSI